MSNESILIVIEGDIAAGKTTLGKSLACNGFSFVEESYAECDWLNLFYAEEDVEKAKGYLFQFQTWLIEDDVTRMSKICDLLESGCKKIALDRCILGCEAFLSLYENRGFMDPLKKKALSDLVTVIWKDFQDRIMIKFDEVCLIYLETDPHIGYKRYIDRQLGQPTKLNLTSFIFLHSSKMFDNYRNCFSKSARINTNCFSNVSDLVINYYV